MFFSVLLHPASKHDCAYMCFLIKTEMFDLRTTKFRAVPFSALLGEKPDYYSTNREATFIGGTKVALIVLCLRFFNNVHVESSDMCPVNFTELSKITNSIICFETHGMN